MCTTNPQITSGSKVSRNIWIIVNLPLKNIHAEELVHQVRGITAFVEGRSSVPCTQLCTHNDPYFSSSVSNTFLWPQQAAALMCSNIYINIHIHAIKSKVVAPLFHLWLYPSVEYVWEKKICVLKTSLFSLKWSIFA